MLLIVASLTVANPGTEDGAIFYSLVIVIISSAISDALDQRINVVSSGRFRPDLFAFKYAFWAMLEAAQLTGKEQHIDGRLFFFHSS